MQIKKHSAYTMIELVFVILITGILAMVALPKLIGISTEAKKSKVLAYVGTLNRTTGPSMWAKVVNDTTNPGKVVGLCSNITNYIEVIPEVTVAADCKLSFTDVPNPTINTFEDGTDRKGPKWTVEF